MTRKSSGMGFLGHQIFGGEYHSFGVLGSFTVDEPGENFFNLSDYIVAWDGKGCGKVGKF